MCSYYLLAGISSQIMLSSLQQERSTVILYAAVWLEILVETKPSRLFCMINNQNFEGMDRLSGSVHKVADSNKQ